MLLSKRGQSTLEYALLIAAVSAALLVVNVYMKKGVQGRIKESVDQVGKSFDPANYTRSWQDASNGLTTTTEARDTGGNVTSKVSTSETVTRGEYETFGTTPTPHY